MDTGWWIGLGVVVLIALVAAYVDGTRRIRPSRRRDGSRRDGTPPPED